MASESLSGWFGGLKSRRQAKWFALVWLALFIAAVWRHDLFWVGFSAWAFGANGEHALFGHADEAPRVDKP